MTRAASNKAKVVVRHANCNLMSRGCALCLAANWQGSFLGGSHLTGALAIVAVIGLFFYTGSFAIGLGPVLWLLIAEIYPLKIRGAAMSVATMANWAASFVVTISFLTLLNAISGVGTFFLFAFLTVAALAYFWRKVPETKGRSLQEIERDLAVEPGAVEAIPAAGH